MRGERDGDRRVKEEIRRDRERESERERERDRRREGERWVRIDVTVLLEHV